ncbi:tRNA methyltransferase, putative [Plasmodium ovale]|uniref:tRNA methyltransferase, putative n=2 Tax=Plasmodium ovale TaxID=36330 RepID=A0A1A8VP24_PLAOA|nr:tRNA methyltransferase, putative [Plasmodium ovale curtisi]SBS83799.1 tRNA methyltransferase, putative [Plasmodium ovale curtisi]SCP03829.1 tRNA methyltransferase, putative [Plasmodium ovale]
MILCLIVLAILCVQFVRDRNVLRQHGLLINQQCYLISAVWRERLNRGRKKCRGMCISDAEGKNTLHRAETCTGTPSCDATCRNIIYRRNIERVYEHLHKLNQREDKINHLVRENIGACKNNYFPIARKTFKNKYIHTFTKGKKKCYINEVGNSVYYRFINKCNSSVYIAVDIEEKEGEAVTSSSHDEAVTSSSHGEAVTSSSHGEAVTSSSHGEAVTSSSHGEAVRGLFPPVVGAIYKETSQEGRNNIKSKGNFTQVYSTCQSKSREEGVTEEKGLIVEKNKYLISIDACSDNLVLCCFLHLLLKGLYKIELSFFLKMNFKKIATDLKNYFTIHFNTEQVANYVYEYVQNFLSKVSTSRKRDIVIINSSGSFSKTKNKQKKEEATKPMTHVHISQSIGVNNNMEIFPYPRVAHMLSGGIDSLMALILLEKKKLYIDNFFFNFNTYDCSRNDMKYVKRICKRRKNLNIINVNDVYFKKVFIPMLRSYSEGKIPNPDIMCNKKIKHDLFFKIIKRICKKKGRDFNYSYISTGHYAILSTNDSSNVNNLFNNKFPYVQGKDIQLKWLNVKKRSRKFRSSFRTRYNLITAMDEKKDQTFFLSSFSERQLSKFLFPLGLYRKSDIKLYMKRNNIDLYNKNETRGLCLYGNVDVHMLLQCYLKGGGNNIQNDDLACKKLKEGKKVSENTYDTFVQQMQMHTRDFLTFKEKYASQLSLNYVNYIISIDDEIVMDRNSDVHLYAIGQNKHITNFIHQLYNRRMKKGEKNYFSSNQWTVFYKKMIRRVTNGAGERERIVARSVAGSVMENFVYVTRNYCDDMFACIRRKCKVMNIRWIAGKCPPCVRMQSGRRQNGRRRHCGETNEKERRMGNYEDRVIFVKTRNNEHIKKAKITFTDDSRDTAYLRLHLRDIGLSPGQIITFYFPFIIKKDGSTKYVLSLRKYANHPVFFHCIGTSEISHQYLDKGLYRRIRKIHEGANLTIF